MSEGRTDFGPFADGLGLLERMLLGAKPPDLPQPRYDPPPWTAPNSLFGIYGVDWARPHRVMETYADNVTNGG